MSAYERMEAELEKQGLLVKHHEDNLKCLREHVCSVNRSILDTQVVLGKLQSLTTPGNETQMAHQKQTELQTVDSILEKDKTAAGIICKLKFRHGAHASKLPITKDILGIIATLGKVKDDNLSRILSEYLGTETMLAVVCKTFEGVRTLEEYDKKGNINMNVGLHGLGPSIGTPLEGRFSVICLENLRPYMGKFVTGDSQRRLELLKPCLPNGECPLGFLGYAVNMIDLEDMHISFVTANGYGLRETLFYCLFSRIQVYATRADMRCALPYIADGAVSLDGGIMKSSAFLRLGNQEDSEIRFPICSLATPPSQVAEAQKQFKQLCWKKERLSADIEREETLLHHERNSFNVKKHEYLKYLTDTANATQNHILALPKPS